ncbi:MAG: DNA polymerase III subunit gamma/tau [Candidatus Omnitrophota bacterium]|nr:MAG: DNA polymerase III subunit gamma/tau [Candidatus Omnitrophota bacterium]
MSYLVFARKYRPQDFSEVVGQEGVVKRLTECINSKRIHQAYLFSGPRGVGKTSLARILAKAFNCQSFPEPTPKPCRKCASCVEIQEGRSLDVIEIDGASNRGIDEIRELRENVKFKPSYSRYKVYIIDEVHQITDAAFNALLKTLEEPPDHVKFIFATTAPYKVPLTILSRCQRFNFRLLSEGEIIRKLEFIAKKENIPVDKDILRYVARASSGSIRDAESIFDQIVPLLTEGVKFEDILDILGQIPEAVISSFVENLLKKELENLLTFINEVVEQGYELGNFLDGVIEYIRNIILAKLGRGVLSRIVGVSAEAQERFLELSKITDIPFLIKIIESLIEVKKIGRFFPSLRVPLEVEVVKLTHFQEAIPEKEKPSNIEQTEELKTSLDTFKHKSATLNLEGLSKFVKSLKGDTPPEGSQEEPSFSEEKSEETITEEEVKAVWEELIEDIASTKMSIATYLKEAEVKATEGRVIKLGFPKNFKFPKEFLEGRERKRMVEEAFSRKLNKKVGVEYLLTEEVRQVQNHPSRPKEDLGKIIKSFDGEIIT